MNTHSIRTVRFPLLAMLCMVLLFSACRKKEYTYEVNSVDVVKDGVTKTNLKTDVEFISIAYSDLFGTTITNDKLVKLNIEYDAFGDKKLIEDLIVRNFLNDPAVQLPTKAYMDANLDTFISDTYKKFFNRLPNEMEAWNLKKIISADNTITPELVYYSFMTSNEYRYY